MLDAVLPVVVLIVLLALTIWLFGVSATDGPLQVALLLGAAFASLMALKNGYTTASVADAAIIRHALRAITSPANAVVHVKEVGAQDGTPVAVEWWQQTSPPHALRMIKGPVGQGTEAANDGTTSYVYDAAANTVDKTAGTSAPTLVDPIAGVRRQLANGGARVAGTATINGTTLYKLELSTGVIAYFSTGDYRPMYLDNPQRGGSVVRTRVVAYDELPMTPDSAKLLSITAQHPDARVRSSSAPVK
jgi:hypothetical protein